MENKGTFYTKDGRKIYVIREICDYFGKDTFMRMLGESEYARQNGAGLYVALYSDSFLESQGIAREFKGVVEDEDRVAAVEALNFVDGAFVIPSLEPGVEEGMLSSKILDQETERKSMAYVPQIAERFGVGYASGAFTNLHKGHVEHLREMAS